MSTKDLLIILAALGYIKQIKAHIRKEHFLVLFFILIPGQLLLFLQYLLHFLISVNSFLLRNYCRHSLTLCSWVEIYLNFNLNIVFKPHQLFTSRVYALVKIINTTCGKNILHFVKNVSFHSILLYAEPKSKLPIPLNQYKE